MRHLKNYLRERERENVMRCVKNIEREREIMRCTKKIYERERERDGTQQTRCNFRRREPLEKIPPVCVCVCVWGCVCVCVCVCACVCVSEKRMFNYSRPEGGLWQATFMSFLWPQNTRIRTQTHAHTHRRTHRRTHTHTPKEEVFYWNDALCNSAKVSEEVLKCVNIFLQKSPLHCKVKAKKCFLYKLRQENFDWGQLQIYILAQGTDYTDATDGTDGTEVLRFHTNTQNS